MKIGKSAIQFEGERHPRRFVKEDVITFIVLVASVTGFIFLINLFILWGAMRF